MSLDLSALARELIGGAHGAGAAFAMRLLARFAEAIGARSLIDIEGRSSMASSITGGPASISPNAW